MSSLVFSLLAAGCTSLSILLFRKNADNSTASCSPSGYPVLFYFFFVYPIFPFFIRYLESRYQLNHISYRWLCRALEFYIDAIDSSSIETRTSRPHFCFSICERYFSWLNSFFIVGFRFWPFHPRNGS